MIEAVALHWAQWLKKTVPDHPSSVAVIKFALQLLLGAVLTVLLALVIAAFTGKLLETITVLICFAVLRAVSGGFHFKSAMACVVATVAGANILAYSTFEPNIVLVLNGTSLLLIALFAPSKIEKQTRIPKKHHPKLRIIALLIAATNFLFMSPIIAATITIQSITLIRVRR